MELDLSGHFVLLVDDEKFSRAIIGHLLAEMGKPKIGHANNGREALELLDAEDGRITFVISDFSMPIMHGLELLKAIRAGHRGIDRSLPVALVTGYSEKHMVDLALALDVNAFLIKPVSKEGLARRLENMLMQGHGNAWLKPGDMYADIEVQNVLDEIMSTQSDWEAGGARRIFLGGKDVPLMRDAKRQAKKRKKGPQKPVEGYECMLDAIPEGATLARDVHTADGRLFMQAGAKLTQRVIAILHDLRSLDHPVNTIWIAR